MLLGALMQVAVVEVGWLNRAFSTAPLTVGQWGLCLGMASAVVWASELHKWAMRHFSTQPPCV